MDAKEYAALSTGETIDPSDVAETGKFSNEECGVLVLIKLAPYGDRVVGKKPIALTGWHLTVDPKWGAAAGEVVELIADQSCRRMGRYRVLGVKEWGPDGRVDGVVESKKLRHFVMK